MMGMSEKELAYQIQRQGAMSHTFIYAVSLCATNPTARHEGRSRKI